jgi:thiol-disulfide isomerase/thioredoxin
MLFLKTLMKRVKPKYCIFFILFSLLLLQSCNMGTELALGEWQGELKLNDSTNMPFTFVVDENDDGYVFIVVNGAESIPLKFDNAASKGNHFVYHFDIFDTYIFFDVQDENHISGVFVNENRKDHREISFVGYKKETDNAWKNDLESALFTGKWQVAFNYKSPGVYPAIGEFADVNDIMIGTFRTETGDYRFLSGYVEESTLKLSAFDGSHLFYFQADIAGDSLVGRFYSGSHWSTDWYGVRNDTFELPSPYELTQLISDEPFEFSKTDLNGEEYNYPNEALKDKVVIIQLMGSWCPNCLDETMFYNELYDRYVDKGLEIIAIGYEMQSRLNERIERLTRYKNRMQIKYPLLVGGDASKDGASKDFPMFNAIISFPTSIYINRAGEVVKIHTGFNGPGTGGVYENYVERTTTMIEHLLEE